MAGDEWTAGARIGNLPDEGSTVTAIEPYRSQRAAVVDSPGIRDLERYQRLSDRVLTLDQLAKLPPVEFVVPEVLPSRGLGFLYGPSGHGKSFVAVDLALSIAAGIAYAGRPTRQARVLYLAAEGASGFQKRTEAWRAHNPHGDPGDAFMLLPEAVNLADPSGLDTVILALIAEDHGAQLVIIDTLARAMTGADENSSKDMGVFIANAEAVARSVDGLTLVVHHTGKDATKGMRGSSAAFGGADVVIECGRIEDEITLKCAKAKDFEEFRAQRFKMTPRAGSIALQYDTGQHQAPVDDAKLADLLRIIDALDDGSGVPGKLVELEYQSGTGRGRTEYFEVKKQAVKRGTVRNLGPASRPRFSLTGAGFDVLGIDSP